MFAAELAEWRAFAEFSAWTPPLARHGPDERCATNAVTRHTSRIFAVRDVGTIVARRG